MRGAFVAGAIAGMLVAGAAHAANPHALWQVVHDRCVPDEDGHASPKPCEIVDQKDGFAVLKDIHGSEQFLLIPTARVSGIESPAVLAPGAPNYFAEAWAQIPLVDARLHRMLPRDDVSLAINSQYGRSQDQLHIHIDCIDRSAHDALFSELDDVGAQWTDLPGTLAGHHYRAMRIDALLLGDVNPFRLLAASLTDPARTMGRHTLVLVGVDGPRPGFVLLDDQVSLLGLDHASGEELQDHDCAIASAAPMKK